MEIIIKIYIKEIWNKKASVLKHCLILEMLTYITNKSSNKILITLMEIPPFKMLNKSTLESSKLIEVTPYNLHILIRD